MQVCRQVCRGLHPVSGRRKSGSLPGHAVLQGPESHLDPKPPGHDLVDPGIGQVVLDVPPEVPVVVGNQVLQEAEHVPGRVPDHDHLQVHQLVFPVSRIHGQEALSRHDGLLIHGIPP